MGGRIGVVKLLKVVNGDQSCCTMTCQCPTRAHKQTQAEEPSTQQSLHELILLLSKHSAPHASGGLLTCSFSLTAGVGGFEAPPVCASLSSKRYTGNHHPKHLVFQSFPAYLCTQRITRLSAVVLFFLDAASHRRLGGTASEGGCVMEPYIRVCLSLVSDGRLRAVRDRLPADCKWHE